MPKTPCPPTSPSLLPAARSPLKLKVRNNRKVGQARSTQGKGVPLPQVRRANLRPECNLRLKVPRKPRLNLTRTNNKRSGTMSAPDDSYRTAPTWELIDDLLDNRPEVFKRAKTELLVRLKNTKKEKLIELAEMEETNK